MKEIIKTYGSCIIAAMISLSMIYLVCFARYGNSVGILAVIGNMISNSSNQIMTTDNETDAYKEYINTKIKSVELKDNLDIRTGEKILASECFENEILPQLLTILGVKNEEGIVKQPIHENGVDYFYFEEAGIYQIFFEIRNEKGAKDYGSLFIPVNKKGAVE